MYTDIKQLAKALAAKGRNGDEVLVHMTPAELEELRKTGGVTINPDTGLPEAFGLGSIGHALSSGFNKVLNPFSDENIFRKGVGALMMPLQNPTIQKLGALAGAGYLASGAAGAGEAAGGASASPQGLNPALVGSGEPGLSTAYAGGGVGLNPATGAAAFDSALSPEMQALLGAGAGAGAAGEIGMPVLPTAGGGGGGAAGGGTAASASPQGLAAPGAASSAPSLGSAAAPSAGAGAPAAATGGHSVVDNILAGMRNNAGLIQLGISGAALGLAASRPSIPNEQQLNDLANTGSQAAKDLINSYRSGQLSAAQQVQLDQSTQNARNQIRQYFASIGQSDSTAAVQAMQMVDQQAMQMRQQMLDNMLQQGLSAIGVASGPLNTVAQYQLGQDKALIDALGNFAGAVGQGLGKKPAQPQGATPSTGQGTAGEITGQETTSAGQ